MLLWRLWVLCKCKKSQMVHRESDTYGKNYRMSKRRVTWWGWDKEVMLIEERMFQREEISIHPTGKWNMPHCENWRQFSVAAEAKDIIVELKADGEWPYRLM